MISIIVPVYNVAVYLRQCIESLLNQTYKNIEVVLVNDGSTDGGGDICEEFRRKDPRVVVLHKENGGLVSARKAGLKASRGRYIACVDGDDWIEPDMYERMHCRMTEKNVDIVMCGRYEDTGDVKKEVYHGIPEGRYGKSELLCIVYPEMIAGESFFEWGIFPGLWDKLFRRDCLERFQYAVDERITMGEDAACTYPCLLNADSIYVMHKCLYHYRQTASSMVKQVQDCVKEREQFHILYQSVNESLGNYADIFDVREQWKKYVLFLMLPRADGLYEGFEELEYLFPFPQVKKGMDIVLYGAGTYGQRLFRYLHRTGFCRVTAWVDRNFIQLRKLGLDVDPPKVIPQRQYDAIVIANTYEKSRKALWKELCGKYPGKLICQLDEGCIFDSKVFQAFGLSD